MKRITGFFEVVSVTTKPCQFRILLILPIRKSRQDYRIEEDYRIFIMMNKRGSMLPFRILLILPILLILSTLPVRAEVAAFHAPAEAAGRSSSRT
ncbi:MAG: hypothetical protein IT175_05105 [Acidobacteria bacterium]|nr:hypothetical protein [Acidobacteriota bacterium]